MSVRGDGKAMLCIAGLVVLVATAAACGGSTPASPRPTTTTTMAPPRVTFVGEANPGDDSIALSLMSSTATDFTLVLAATNVTDLYGYAVDLTFDPEVVLFESAEAESFLDGDGVTVTTQVVEQPTGTLVIGQTRVGAAPGVSGSGTLLALNFKSVTQGTSLFAPSNSGAFDAAGVALATAFYGGTATVPPQPAR